jgi:hypothetical protein
MKFIKRLFCRHSYAFYSNIYGDAIIDWGWKRSLWRCEKCDKLQARDDLVKDDGSIKFIP